ncbi:MAG: histidine phosphatase family protein [Pirellulales bacterium]|nr:histidine phosphatase family protein [Pirellulales bacterium]
MSHLTPPADTCLLYLLRHGATENNVAQPPRLQGRRSNLGLSAKGREQAEDAARLLAAHPLTAVYASPLLRALETAQAIAAPHGVAVACFEDLTECDIGQWENRSWVDIEKTDAEAYRLFQADAGTRGYLGGENLNQVLSRVKPVFEEILARHVGQAVAVVCHNVVNRVWLAHLLDMPMSVARGIPQENCGINLVRYRAGAAKVWTVNAVSHLRDWQ